MKEASDGNVYYLIKMQINKDGSTEAIDWASLKLTDSDGNEYTRIDDEFLTNLGMTRMAGTKLNFGSNEAGSLSRSRKMLLVLPYLTRLNPKLIPVNYRIFSNCFSEVQTRT